MKKQDILHQLDLQRNWQNEPMFKDFTIRDMIRFHYALEAHILINDVEVTL